MLLILAAIAAAGFALARVFNSGYFDVKEISVSGAQIASEEEIKSASGIREGDNIFLLNLNQARAGINALTSMTKVNITRVMPDKVEITVQETQPLFIINCSGTYCYFNEHSVLLESGTELRRDDVPLVTGFEAFSVPQRGQSVAIQPDWKFDYVLRMLKSFKNAGMLGKLSEIDLTSSNTYRIITKSGLVFTVKDYSNFHEYFGYISSVIDNGESNQDINLTTGSNPVKKPR